MKTLELLRELKNDLSPVKEQIAVMHVMAAMFSTITGAATYGAIQVVLTLID